MFVHSLPALLDLAGRSNVLQALAIVFGTFILEDAATVLAALRSAAGGVSMPLALVSLYVGIVLGDLGLYGAGRLARRMRWLREWFGEERLREAGAGVDAQLFKVVLASRFLPGARLPTYTACGFLGCNLRRFVFAAIVATLAWTSLLFAVSIRIGAVILDHLGAWRWVGAVGLAATVVLLGRVAARMRRYTP